MDVELPQVESFNEDLKARFAKGEADMAILDQAVRRILIHKFRLGLFENPFPMEKEERDAVIQEKEAQAISRNMAREAMILLKNDGVLPLKMQRNRTERKIPERRKSSGDRVARRNNRAFYGMLHVHCKN